MKRVFALDVLLCPSCGAWRRIVGVFTTADGHYRRLCAAIGAPALIDDPRFKTIFDRSKNRKQMNAELDRVLVRRSSAEWIEVLNKAGVPSGPIYNVRQVFEDPATARTRSPRSGRTAPSKLSNVVAGSSTRQFRQPARYSPATDRSILWKFPLSHTIATLFRIGI